MYNSCYKWDTSVYTLLRKRLPWRPLQNPQNIGDRLWVWVTLVSVLVLECFESTHCVLWHLFSLFFTPNVPQQMWKTTFQLIKAEHFKQNKCFSLVLSERRFCNYSSLFRKNVYAIWYVLASWAAVVFCSTSNTKYLKSVGD